jgi:hypothetical protein
MLELIDKLHPESGLAKEVCISYGFTTIIHKLKAKKVKSGDFVIILNNIKGTRVLNTARTLEESSDILYDEALNLLKDTQFNYQRGGIRKPIPIRTHDFKAYLTAMYTSDRKAMSDIERTGKQWAET